MVAESVLVKHQLRILNRGRKREPNLRAADRIIAGLCTLFMRPTRVLRSAIVLKTSTLLYDGVDEFFPRSLRARPTPALGCKQQAALSFFQRVVEINRTT